MTIGTARLLDRLQEAIGQRRRQEEALADSAGHRDPELESLQHQWQASLDEQTAALAQIEARVEEARQAVLEEHAAETAKADADRDQVVKSTVRALDAEANALERQHSESQWVVSSVMDEDGPRQRHERYVNSIERSREDQQTALSGLTSSLEETALVYKYRLTSPEPSPEPLTGLDELQDAFQTIVIESSRRPDELKGLKLNKLIRGWRGLVLLGVLWLTGYVVVSSTFDPAVFGVTEGRTSTNWQIMCATIGGVASLVITLILYLVASGSQSQIFRQWEQSLADAGAIQKAWDKQVQDDLAQREPAMLREQARLDAQRESTIQRHNETFNQRMSAIRHRRETTLNEAYHQHYSRVQAANQLRDARLQELQDWEAASREALQQSSSETQNRLQAEISALQQKQQRAQLEAWSKLKGDWDHALQEVSAELKASNERVAAESPDWSELAGRDIERPTTIPSVIRLGETVVDLAEWPDAIPADPRLAPRESQWVIPEGMEFPGRPSLLLKSRTPEGRAAALSILQTAMLRLLTALPPGTVRFTLIDPVGLGDSFASFMHLADVDDALVSTRIWTETSQIEARLADLSEHMENVLQTYLRNEFPTLEAYNEHAGEVAEPYRIVVIRDFPARFSEIAARRLTSIINSGPRCGVYTLMSIDGKLQLPNHFHLEDITPLMNVFEWRDTSVPPARALDWIDEQEDALGRPPVEEARIAPVFRPGFYREGGPVVSWPLKIDELPSPELTSQIIKSAGEASRGARKVEVAFERIAPSEGEQWTLDSRRGLDVPMGRAGAVKLQHVRLGQGTSQHMLIAGKTGSGKSTFLHGLITNLALFYSPDELQFFLIDFKKGVEFADYARFRLPHAQVIAIESDREFGVSALSRLDGIMQERGELFRRRGVQDITGFRNAHPDELMPRILLVIDEFQEFFTEEDKTSQTAALMLDRLVRQGRAFGVHVVLGSQTLGGAYSLARSTLGQVAVRVALQCSEADAHLILSEENTAARLLSRPGEAIYNDANGTVEGNHPFQIAWLPDDKREQYLKDLQELASERKKGVASPIVFEGNIPSDLMANQTLQKVTSGEAEVARRKTAPQIWLGDAVEIGEPASLILERQSSQNILVVGQDAEAVQGLYCAAAVALVAQDRADSVPRPQGSLPVVTLLDGSSADDPVKETWQAMEQILGARFRRVTPRDVPEWMAEVTAGKTRREENRDELSGTSLVMVYNLSRFRELRKAEDDFGFGGFGSSATPAPVSLSKQFSQLLTTGPDVGLHVMVWADSYNNVERWFSRQMLKDFELRILFPMNSADSSNLIDSPQAAKLGTGRALLYRDDRGSSEKFRPYAVLTADQLVQLLGKPEPRAEQSPQPESQPTAAVEPPKKLPVADVPPDELEIATELDDFIVL